MLGSIMKLIKMYLKTSSVCLFVRLLLLCSSLSLNYFYVFFFSPGSGTLHFSS